MLLSLVMFSIFLLSTNPQKYKHSYALKLLINIFCIVKIPLDLLTQFTTEYQSIKKYKRYT